MPRTTRPAAYGPEYEQLLLRAFAEERLTVPLPSEGHAKALRSKLYVYFTALRRDGTRPDLVAKADAVALNVTDNVLTISLAKDSWDNAAIRDALKGFGPALASAPAPPPSLQDQMRAKLTDLRAKNNAQL